MAAYTDIAQKLYDAALLARFRVAVCVAAFNLLDSAPDAAARKWAKAVFYEPKPEALKALRYVLAKNNTAPVNMIESATDAQVQAEVEAVVPALVAAMSGE